MEFRSSNLDDIRRYYLNSYVKFAETGDELYFLQYVDPYKLEGKDEKGDIIRLYLDDAHPYNITYALPHKSYYQYKNMAAQLVRVPAKQYVRGICSENTQIHCLRGGAFGKVGLDFSALKAYVNKQKFYSLREAVEHSKTDGCLFSYVLTPRMAYDPSTRSVYLDQTSVAEVSDDFKKIRVTRPIFREEVQTMLNGENEFTVQKSK